MFVIDVPFETLRVLNRQHQTAYFYMEVGDNIELYSPTNEGILFRTVYPKGSDMENALFAEKYLKDSVQILDIKNIDHSDKILNMLGMITQTVIDIRDMVARSLEKEMMEEGDGAEEE